MTKALVATGALLLVQQGKLALDGKVSSYLGKWGWDDAAVTVRVADDDGGNGGGGAKTVPAARPITVRMLCCHASGVGSPTPIGFNPYTGAAPTCTTLRQFAAVVNATPLAHQPGRQFHYAMSTDLLGAVIEAVTGQTLARRSSM